MTQLSKMVHALDEYDTSEKLSQLIQMNDIKGRVKTTTHCPVAQLLTKIYGGRFVVGQAKIIRRTGNGVTGKERIEEVRTPTHIKKFVVEFDAGKMPEIVAFKSLVPKQKRTAPRGQTLTTRRRTKNLAIRVGR